MYPTEIVATLKDLGWSEYPNEENYDKYYRFKIRSATGWEHVYVERKPKGNNLNDAYLCLHPKFYEWRKEFKKSFGITIGGRDGKPILQSSNMTDFPLGDGRTGDKIPEYFPLRFQSVTDLKHAVAVISNMANILNVQTPEAMDGENLKLVNIGQKEFEKTASLGSNTSIFDDDGIPPDSPDCLGTRAPISPEADELRRKRQAENGELGEQLAMQYEIARLTELGCPNSVDHVRQVSLIDVGAGFDIHSNWNGDERCIEVKASELGVDHFFISINELIRLGELRERGWIYRVDLSNREKLMECVDPIQNAGVELNKVGVLEATQFKATIRR